MTCYRLDGIAPAVAASAFVHPDAVLIGNVRVAEDASIWPGAVLRADDGPISIGSRTSVQDGCVLHVTARHPTIIGAGCVVGHLAHLEGCTIDDEVLIGSGAVVLAGAVVSSGSVVGANAVVTGGLTVPPGALAIGVPARIREDAADIAMIRQGALDYVRRKDRYLAGMSPVPHDR